MKKNMGNIDRIVRVLVAVIVAALYFTNVISGTVAIVLGVLAIILYSPAWLVSALCTPFLGFQLVKPKRLNTV